MFSTERFTIRPSEYTGHALGIWWNRRGWILIIPLVGALLLSFSDLRMLIAALMLALVLYPAILFFVYYRFAFREEAAAALIPHTVVYDTDGVHISYFQPESADDDTEPVEYTLPPARHIPAYEIEAVEHRGDYIVIHYKGAPYDFTIVPDNAVVTPDTHSEDF